MIYIFVFFASSLCTLRLNYFLDTPAGGGSGNNPIAIGIAFSACFAVKINF